MIEKYLKQLEKLIFFLHEKYGFDSSITYDNAIDRAIEKMNEDKWEIRHGDGKVEHDSEWFPIQTADADRDLFSGTVYIRKIK